ncbi:MAG: hypothetical protein CVT48_03055 [Thermoplasmata archaeon HGW-Thermoplasmata-1]|nr:MAG: hypothetical protein CVT48_03055 [Thermoplasmata archaeon HGW-Thermoplasmata-1]
MKFANKLGDAISSLSLYSASRPKQVVIVISICTLLAAGGILQLETSSNMVNILPRNDPNTLAAHNVSDQFPLFYDCLKVYLTIDETKWQAANAKLPFRMTTPDSGDALDEVYVRAMEEFCGFLQPRCNVRYSINLGSVIKTVNWTNSAIPGVKAADDAAFSMPGTDAVGEFQYFYSWQALRADPSYEDTVSPDHKSLFTILMFDMGNTTHIGIGDSVYLAVDEYKVWAPEHAEYDVFSLDAIAVSGTPAVDAYASKTLGDNISLLSPLVIGFIVIAVLIAFREFKTMLICISMLVMTFIWTLGLMGYARIPFSALNMAIIPLILGTGIDYSIHMVSEYIEHRDNGKSNAEAFAMSGFRAGLALLIATVTTIIGLTLMVLSPSVLMAQLGFISAIAMSLTFLFTVTFIPAVLTLTGKKGIRKKRTRKSRVTFPAIVRWINRRPAVGIAAIILTTLLMASFMPSLKTEVFGDQELNYAPGHRLRDDRDWINEVFWGGRGDSVINMIVLEGDMTQPELHTYMDTLENNLRGDTAVSATETASITRVVKGYIAVQQGTAGAAGNMAQEGIMPGSSYPTTQEELKGILDAMFANPVANYASFLLAPDGYNIALLAFTTQQGNSFEEAERVWNEVWRVIDETNAEYGGSAPMGTKISIFGPTSFSYLFISGQMPWVNYIGVISLILICIILLFLTRNAVAVGAVAAVMAVSSIWWYGLLSIIGIGLSVTLMLPLIFIICLGSDYAVHLIWNIEQSGNAADCYNYVGKAIFFSALTTFGAFCIFSAIADLMVQKAMFATALAILITFLATMCVVPLFYPIGKIKGKNETASFAVVQPGKNL